MKVTIELPDDCMLVKKGDTYVVKKINDVFPTSWSEFCRLYPSKGGECYINSKSNIIRTDNAISSRDAVDDRNLIATSEEAEAFLALMQLRRLRDVYVNGYEFDWAATDYPAIVPSSDGGVSIEEVKAPRVLAFPIYEIAESFNKHFAVLIEKAKLLL